MQVAQAQTLEFPAPFQTNIHLCFFLMENENEDDCRWRPPNEKSFPAEIYALRVGPRSMCFFAFYVSFFDVFLHFLILRQLFLTLVVSIFWNNFRSNTPNCCVQGLGRTLPTLQLLLAEGTEEEALAMEAEITKMLRDISKAVKGFIDFPVANWQIGAARAKAQTWSV